MNIGENIKLVRRAKGLTQEELATRLGYTKSYMSLVESGRRALGKEDLTKITRVLGVSLDDLQSRVTIHFRSESASPIELRQVEQGFLLHARNQTNKTV